MKDNVIKRLIRYIGRDRRTMIIVLISSVLSSLAYLLCPKIIGNAVDAMFDGTDTWAKTAFIYLGVLLALYLINAFLVWLTSLLANKVAIATTKRLRDEVFAKLSKLPLKYFDRTPAGETISRATNDIEAINDGLANAIVQLVSGSASVLLALGFMISLNIKVALVAVFVTPLCFFTGFIITRYGKAKFSTQAKAVGAGHAYAAFKSEQRCVVQLFDQSEIACEKRYGKHNDRPSCGAKFQKFAGFGFLESYDLSGKLIIPFCTSGGSDIAETMPTFLDSCDGLAVYGEKRILASDEMDGWLSEIGFDVR